MPVSWPCVDEHLGLVEHRPGRDPVAQRSDHRVRVLGEPADHRAVGPAARVLHPLRQVPVVQRRVGRDAVGEQLVDEPVVVVEAGAVDRAARVRDDPRPRDAEAVRPEAELLQERDVLGVAVVLVAGDVARGPVDDPARRVREPVPDRLALAVLLPGALDLVGGGGRPPHEAGRERRSSQHGWDLLLPRRARAGGCRRTRHPSTTSTRTRGVPGSGSGISVPSIGRPSTTTPHRSACRRVALRRPRHLDVVGRAPEPPRRPEPGPGAGDHGLHPQAVVLGADAQDPLADRHHVPGRRPGQPRVLGLAVGGRVAPRDHLGVDVRLAAVHVRDRLAGRRVDPQVVVEGALAVARDRLADHQPRVRVAEDPGVLLVAGRVRGDLAQLEVVGRVGRLLEHDPVGRRQPLPDGRDRGPRASVLEADARHRHHPLGLDEDLALVVDGRADGLPDVVVRPPVPGPVPAVGLDGRRHRGGRRARSATASASSPTQAGDRLRLPRGEHEQAGDEHGLGDAAGPVGGRLEGLARPVREDVEVEAVVPVRPPDERQAVRAQPLEGEVDAPAQVVVERRLGALGVVPLARARRGSRGRPSP